MPRQLFLLWIPVGLLAGGLGVFVMRARRYGLIADVVLGLAGSFIGSLLFFALESAPEEGWLTLSIGAFLGAASVIVGQRWWYAHI
jgi:uncharacterized membrane protein YeaQ/YmgE (transglycosylase-associated protein family)